MPQEYDAEIALIGTLRDPTMTYVRERFSAAAIDYVFIDIDEIAQSKTVEFNWVGKTLSILFDRTTIEMERFTAIYNRLWSVPNQDPEIASRSYSTYVNLASYLRLTHALVVNRPEALFKNSSKLLQMADLAEFGFVVPEWLVSSNARYRAEQVDAGGEWITKGCSGVRTRVEKLIPEDGWMLGEQQRCPPLMQKLINGPETRVHVIGRHTFALQIDSPMPDYRYAERQGGEAPKFTITELETNSMSLLLEYCKSNNLLFAGADFITDEKTGELYILEVNPMPGFDFFDRHLNGQIVDHLARLLVNTSKRESVADVIFADCETVSEPFLAFDRRPGVCL